MARIELNIVALGDFSSINAQVKALQTQVQSLNKTLIGVGVSPQLAKDLSSANAAFKSALLSSGQFTATTVKMASETEKFGQALISGKLKLSDYFNIITGKSSQATASLKALAAEQVKLQNSIVMSDPTKKGIFSVYTPTQINAVAQATKLARTQQDLYNLSLESSSKALINWGKNTQWAGRQLTVGLTMPMVLFGATAAKTFQAVNDELVRLQKVYGTGLTTPTQAVLDQIKGQTVALGKELASSMGIAVKDTAAMAADLAATGKTGNDLITATREAMRLQKLGEMDTQSAMQTTISLQNVYKLNTNQLADAVNFLNAVENQTSTSLQDLAMGIPKVGPIVQQLGGSFKDTAVMMVAMKEAGVPAAQSANAIKSALASLINPTKQAKDAFAAYNVNLSSIATATNGNPIMMIEALQGALKGLQPLVQAQLIEKLFGKFQEARIQALITNLGAVNSQTKTAFDLANSSAPQLAAVAANEIKIATQSTTGQFKRATETLKADLLPIGEKIMQIATVLLKMGDSIGKSFGALPGPIKSFLGIFAGGAAIAGPIIMLTGLMGNFAGYLLKTIANIRMLASGGKSFKELLTPEIIASTNAATLFGQGITDDVAAIDLLNNAMTRLTVTMESLVAAMGASAGGLSRTILAAEAATGGAGLKFASGGIVPGSGSGDTIPAMLTPGESVVTKTATQRYAPVIDAMNKGTLPGFAYGITSAGEKFDVQRGHVLSDHSSDIFNTMSMPSMMEQAGLSSLQSVTKGAMMAMPGSINQKTKEGNAGMSAAQALADYEKIIDANIDPMENLKNVAQKLGANMTEAEPKLDAAFQEMIAGLRAAAKDPTHPGFGKNKGQIPFEEFASQYVTPATNSVKTSVGGNLGAVTGSVIGTRGARIGSKTGRAETAGTMVIQPDGSIVPFNKSYLAGTLNENDVATKQSYAMTNVFKRVSSRAKSALKIQSPSEVMAEEIGKPITQGVAKGMQEAIPSVEAAAKEVANTAEQTAGNTVEETAKKKGKLGVGAKMGASMALMMGGQLATSMLPKGSNVASIGSSVTSMAGMGMMFGPWGAAAGAAIGLVTGGIGALMKAEKEHAAVVKASFTASSDAISMFGGTMRDQTIVMHTFAKDTAASNKELTTLQKNVNAIKALGNDSALKMVSDSIGKMSTASSVIGTAESFAAAQVANGMDPAKVKDMVTAMLTYAGKTEYLNQALKEIVGNTKDLATATETSIRKLKEAAGGINVTTTSYSDLTSKQKLLADGAYQVMNVMLDSKTSFVDVAKLSTALGVSLGNTTSAYNLLIAAAKNAKDSGLADLLTSLSGQGVDIGIAGIIANLDKTTPVKIGQTPEQRIADLKILGEARIKSDNEAAKARNATAMASYNAQVKQAEAAAKKQISAKDALSVAQNELKTLQDQLKTETQISNELKRQQDFQISQGDIENQIKLAQANGDFLKAQMLSQQKASNASDFSRTSADNELQKKIEAKQAEVDKLQLAKDNAAKISGAGANVPKPVLEKVNNQADLSSMIQQFVTALDNYLNNKKVKDSTQFSSGTAAAKAFNAANGGDSWTANQFDNFATQWSDKSEATNNTSVAAQFARTMGYTEGTTFSVDHNFVKYSYKVQKDKQGNIIAMPVSKVALPKKALGGPVTGNTSYLVGEKGPEIFKPNQSGTIVPNHAMSAYNPVGSLIGSTVGNAEKQLGGAVSWISKTVLETIGVSPLMRLLTGKKQTNWDYLGAATLGLGSIKTLGILPKLVAPLFTGMEATDLTQNAAEAATSLKANGASHATTNHYNLNMSFNGSTMNPDDVAREVMNTIKKAGQSNATFTNRTVRT